MPNLLDTIKFQRLARAKSGKLVQAPEIATSAVQEQVAVGESRRKLQEQVIPQIQQEREQQAQKLVDLEQQTQIKQSEIAAVRNFNTVRNRLQINQLFGQLSRERTQLDLERNQAALEQASTLISLQNKQYIQQLQDIGRRRRLTDVNQANEDLLDIVYGDNASLLKRDLEGRNILQISGREFEQVISQIGLSKAIEIADLEIAHGEAMGEIAIDEINRRADTASASAAITGKYQAISEASRGGLTAWEKHEKKKE